MCAASVDTGYFASTDDPATALANRVRKNAGIILAVQIGNEPQYQPPASTAPPAPSYPTPNTAASALPPHPSPRVPRPPATPAQTAMQSRPKTSHTTIEHRYRTNLNARIQSLRQAIPALRIVDRAAAIKAGEPYPGGDASDPQDHIDARGFVDSVKVARKCSKGNVLGKAVEYIRVLKNREKRLMRKLEGPKTLLRGFVEGTELLGSGSEKKMCGRPTKVVPLPASDCVHKPAVRNVRVVSAGRRGIGGKGKEVPALVPFSVSPPFSLFPAAPECAVESSADCTKLDSVVVQLHMHMLYVLLACGDARAEFARTHCADVRPLCCISAPLSFLSPLPIPSFSESVPAACPLRT
ncbi:hypothetical protein B0H16DRAFT_1804942 [Mycena metata]|uniref:BHLH domain-containing protein n=1 Tax=Mycena metata TaxID=1033252 RepID=A0AAD7H9K4_9AGAR|nr:hypothetical protein B0H16DRAFT_1804942 [Mycena metata]